MSGETKSGGGGIGVFGLLGVVFVTLKLCGVIDWSWWWVTAPFWGPIACIIALVAVVSVLITLWAMVAKLAERWI